MPTMSNKQLLLDKLFCNDAVKTVGGRGGGGLFPLKKILENPVPPNPGLLTNGHV
jgi:hypothetical protein